MNLTSRCIKGMINFVTLTLSDSRKLIFWRLRLSVAKKKGLTLDVDFYGLKTDEKLPKSALYLLDSSGKVKQKVTSVNQESGQATIVCPKGYSLSARAT